MAALDDEIGGQTARPNIRRLLVASVDYFPKIGGISLMTHHLANAFADAGVETRILAPSDAVFLPDWPARYELIADRDSRPHMKEGVFWRREEAPRLNRLFGDLYRGWAFDRALLLHPFYYGPALIDFCRGVEIPVSAVFHGFEFRSQILAPIRIKSLLRRLRGDSPTLTQSTLKVAREASEILANSRYTAKLIGKSRTRAPIRVIGCGLDIADPRVSGVLDGDCGDREELRRKFGIPVDKFAIGTLCRLVPSKNVQMLLRTLARMPEACGVVIGDGPEKDALRALAHELGVTRRMVWVDRVSEADKWRMLSALDAFCLLSKENRVGQVEGFGISLLEASAAGAPVIATASGGMVDVVRDGETGFLVPVDDIDALTDRMRRLAKAREEAGALVAAARADIKTRFNWSRIANDLLRRWK
ncbi:MAG: hypothetical protein Tsb0010_13610 [Parvularculaceae bacterium]